MHNIAYYVKFVVSGYGYGDTVLWRVKYLSVMSTPSARKCERSMTDLWKTEYIFIKCDNIE